ncbi:MAG: NDP-sugar synthase [Streptomycetaceae bacterium]|nr:MAG: NDP-sugar synthase [Streptomycetaceae bacterium]
MTQAILLVGGMGTRLMPLTRNVPKPMLPLAGLPVTEHQIAMAKRAGITSIVLATSYLSEVFLPYFGDGARWGMKIQYAVEKEPLGTGGAIRNAAQLLDPNGSIVIFNGDILSSHDLSAQIAFHESKDADVTLHLTHVEDARAFGCVPIDSDGRVTAFLEKMDKPIANTINAGCYVFHPRVIQDIPAETVVSIEREIFPELVDQGRSIYAVVDDSYWIDIGTPSALLRASSDLVSGAADGSALDAAQVLFRSQEYVAMPAASIDPSAVITGGSSIGKGAKVMAGAHIDGSIISEGAVISSGANVIKSFVSAGSIVPAGMELRDDYFANEGSARL